MAIDLLKGMAKRPPPLGPDSVKSTIILTNFLELESKIIINWFVESLCIYSYKEKSLLGIYSYEIQNYERFLNIPM